MAREKKPPPTHADILGNPIEIGTKVAVSKSNMLRICNVTKLNPKMLRVVPVNETRQSLGFLVFPEQAVVVNGEDVLSFILKGNKG